MALLAFLVSFFVRDLINDWLRGISDRGLVIFIPAILLVTFYLGLGPAILTALLSALAAWYYFLPPYYSFTIGFDGMVLLITFVISSGVGIALVYWLRISIAAAQAFARQREVLIETDPNGILVVNPEGRIQLVNSQLTKLFGYRGGDLIGQPVEKLLPERYRGGHIALRAQFSEHPTNRPMGAGRELYGLRKDGSEVPVEISLASFTTEGDELILANVVDITERKQKEQAQATYLRMLDTSFDAIILRDTQARITGWNRGAQSLYGWTREEALGRVIHSLLQTKFPKSLDEILADMHRNGYWEGELIQTHKDGARIVVFSRWTPEWDQKGELISILQTNMDITERKLAETLVAADLRDMMRLNQLSNRLVREGSDFDRNMNAIVDAAIAITDADKGNLQLLDSTTGALTIAAQCGFEEPFLKFFASVRDVASACATAMRSGERVIVEDVQESEIFAGQPSKDMLIDAGVCAVTSTPLLASTGNLLGMISTHFATPHRPNERELHLMDLLARQVADYLERKRADEIEKTLVREIEHRSNNLLAVIQTIANRSLSGNYTLAQAKETFEARLQALARINRQLTKSNWTGASLSELVRLELQPFAERISVEGINVMMRRTFPSRYMNLRQTLPNTAPYRMEVGRSAFLGRLRRRVTITN
jgi:PAS domain S-box-containing protein